MKYVAITLSLIASLFFAGCEGPEGPQGPQGPTGAELLTQIYEIAGINFDSSNDFSFKETFINSTDLIIEDTDLVLIYRQSGIIVETNEPTWELLPATKLVDQGILHYKFEHTSFDFLISFENDFDLNTINNLDGAEFLDNQVFRIAIVPAEIAPEPNLAAKVLGDQAPLSYENIAKDAIFIE